MAQRRLQGAAPASLRELIWAGGDWFLYAFITPLVFGAVDRWPIVRPHLARRTGWHLVLALVFCVGWALGGKALQGALAAIFDLDTVRATLASQDPGTRQQLLRDIASWIFLTLPFGIVVYAAMAALAHALRYFEEARLREAQWTQARLAALQAQVNPHFLFNTLNTIAVRAREGDGRGSAEMVEQLAELLRRTLPRPSAGASSGPSGAETTLAEELELVRLSLAIETARFSDRLRPRFAIDDDSLQGAVPSFALQHLVDNAIRHGLSRRADAGLVEVRAHREPGQDGETLVLQVGDDGPGCDPRLARQPPAHHGLDNTRERLRVLYGDRATLEIENRAGGGTLATLRLPWRIATRSTEGHG